VVAIGVIAGLAIIRYIPTGLPGSRGGLAREFRALGRWPALLPMVICKWYPSRPGRHHPGTVGEIISESWARSNRYTRATSSESAQHLP